MEKVQIEEVVEEASRKILDGGIGGAIYDDFLQQCLNLVFYLENFSAEDERNENVEDPKEPDAICYKKANCVFFSQYRYEELEKIYQGMVKHLALWATKKELTHLQAFRLVVAYEYMFSYLISYMPLPEENPKIRFAQHYLELIDPYKEVNIQKGCFMFDELDE